MKINKKEFSLYSKTKTKKWMPQTHRAWKVQEKNGPTKD